MFPRRRADTDRCPALPVIPEGQTDIQPREVIIGHFENNDRDRHNLLIKLLSDTCNRNLESGTCVNLADFNINGLNCSALKSNGLKGE